MLGGGSQTQWEADEESDPCCVLIGKLYPPWNGRVGRIKNSRPEDILGCVLPQILQI